MSCYSCFSQLTKPISLLILWLNHLFIFFNFIYIFFSISSEAFPFFLISIHEFFLYFTTKAFLFFPWTDTYSLFSLYLSLVALSYLLEPCLMLSLYLNVVVLYFVSLWTLSLIPLPALQDGKPCLDFFLSKLSPELQVPVSYCGLQYFNSQEYIRHSLNLSFRNNVKHSKEVSLNLVVCNLL